MRYFVLLSLWGSAIAGSVGADQPSQQLDEIVRRHKDFAVSRIKDDDPIIASQALDALATLDCTSYMDQLREKLRLPLTDPSLEVAIRHLIKRATPNDLKRVQEIVGEAVKQGEEERKNDPFITNAAYIEFLALEVMLASENTEVAKFATTYLEDTIKRNPGPGVAQMDLALDLIGRYRVKSAAAKVRLDIRKELQDSALSALAKNDQQSALRTLKERVESMQDVRRIIWDSQLVEKLGLTSDQLRAVYRKGDRAVRIAAAGQLARMGHMQELHAITQDVLVKPDDESSVHLEVMIGQYGDESFVRDLDALAPKDASLGGLGTSKMIFQVVNRAKPATRREKTTGKAR